MFKTLLVISSLFAFIAFPIPRNVDGEPWAHINASAVAQKVGTECVTDADTCNPPITAPRTPWRYCEQWHELAILVGWPESQTEGFVLSYVMHRESNCNPDAYNRSGATGLMQLLGWKCPPNGCFDPYSNLLRARQLWETSGWHPWCLRGDPVTGNC